MKKKPYKKEDHNMSYIAYASATNMAPIKTSRSSKNAQQQEKVVVSKHVSSGLVTSIRQMLKDVDKSFQNR